MPIPLENTGTHEPSARGELNFVANSSGPTSNPLDAPLQPCPTDTISAQTVFHETQAVIRGLTTHIQTQEQMDRLLDKLNDLQ